MVWLPRKAVSYKLEPGLLSLHRFDLPDIVEGKYESARRVSYSGVCLDHPFAVPFSLEKLLWQLIVCCDSIWLVYVVVHRDRLSRSRVRFLVLVRQYIMFC